MTRRSLLSLPFLVAPLLAKDEDWLARLGGEAKRDSSGRITSLNLRGSWLDDSEMFEIGNLTELQQLNIAHTRITDEGLLRIKRLKKVEELNLEYVEYVTDSGLLCIRDWRNLTRLNLRGTRVGDGALEIIGGVKQLKALDVSDTDVTDTGFDHLITLTGLEELGLPGQSVGSIGISSLRLLSTLKRLDMSGGRTSRRAARMQPLEEEMVEVLAGLKDLNTLELGRMGVNADSLRSINQLPSVEKLGLTGCSLVEDDAIPAIADWKSLQRLDLQDTQVTAGGVAILQELRPDLRVLSNPGAPPPVLDKSTRPLD